MGLIKTAIYGGAGIYAIKKITEAAETRNNNNNNNNSQRDGHYSSYPGQGEPSGQQYYSDVRQGAYGQAQGYYEPEERRSTPPAYYQGNERRVIEDGAQDQRTGFVEEVREGVTDFSGMSGEKGKGKGEGKAW